MEVKLSTELESTSVCPCPDPVVSPMYAVSEKCPATGEDSTNCVPAAAFRRRLGSLATSWATVYDLTDKGAVICVSHVGPTGSRGLFMQLSETSARESRYTIALDLFV